eukprot:jgi/Mesvir1/8216/Mv12506-RA.2
MSVPLQPSAPSAECVKVVVRCRPLSSKEIADGRQRIVDMDEKIGQITIKNPKADLQEPPKNFTFDSVFNWESEQKTVYDHTAKPIVLSSIEGYNGTIFAYGQTGTGKTHTMEGKEEPPELRGIIPNAFVHIFDEIDMSEDKEFLVRASFLEIYNEEIRDLLGKNSQKSMELKENVDTGVYVRDLTSFVVKGAKEINNVLQVGKKNRTVGATLMNQDSSRSHSIFTITIETSEKIAGDDGGHIRVGKLNLVDLAGSERQSKTGATGDRLKEATKINLSLSALGNVISALVDGKSGHIPYRDSKLTRLLQDSLGGNTKTVMVANVGPADYNYDETMSTLRYANRAKNIKNKPRINEDPKDAMLREFQEEIARLKAALEGKGGGMGMGLSINTGVSGGGDELNDERLAAIKEQMRRELMDNVAGSPMSEEAMAKVKADIEARSMEELQNVLAEKERTEEEKKRIAEEMDRQAKEMQQKLEELEAEKKEREQMAKKLAAMEGKLIHGNEELTAAMKKQKAELKKKEAMLAEQKRLDEENQRRIAELQEMQLIAEDQYSSIQDEVEMKTKKLKKLFTKYQMLKQELTDMSEEFQREREDMLDSIRTLTQQIKLKNIIIENFIPPEEIMRRAHWEEERETWVLERLSQAGNNLKSKRPVSAAGQKRPISDYAKAAAAMGDQNPRFKSENILTMELDMPERTTYDYDGGAVNSRVQAALDAAFVDDGEMLFAASETMPNVYFSYKEDGAGSDGGGSDSSRGSSRPKSAMKKPTSSSGSRPRTASRKAPSTKSNLSHTETNLGRLEDDVPALDDDDQDAAFPKARGLVKR